MTELTKWLMSRVEVGRDLPMGRIGRFQIREGFVLVNSRLGQILP